MVKSELHIAQTTATVAALLGFDPPKGAMGPNETVLRAAHAVLGPGKLDRALLYNPDAIALWLYQKYTSRFTPVIENSQVCLPVYTVMPSVTPVCFASMYTGLLPEKHGIQAYCKPVLKVETLFDAAIAAGRRPLIIATEGDSMSKIFLERPMDYRFFSTPEACNEEALRVLNGEDYDLIAVYNGNYDAQMHRSGPEAPETLAQLDRNARDYRILAQAARRAWAGKRSMTAFLPDHGCHEIDGNLGSHGLEMPEDMNIVHFYGFWA